MSKNTDQGRRNFLMTLGRALLGAVFAGGVGALVARNPEKCINDGICRGCSIFDDCHLPQAMSLRRAMEDKSWTKNLRS